MMYGVALHHEDITDDGRRGDDVPERERCMAAAVVELDTLPDAVGARAQI